MITKDENCNKSPGKKSQVTFATESGQDVQNNVRDNHEDNGQNFRAITGENGNIGLLQTKHEGQDVCTNEKHSVPIVFSIGLLLNLHIYESHKCPACNFSTMLDKDSF